MEESLRKSDINIGTGTEYEQLEQPGTAFLACKISEENETIYFRYDIEGKKSFLQLREEKKIDQYRALLEVAKLVTDFQQYSFMISPQNLYYDRNFRVYIKQREFYEAGIHGNLEEMTAQYQALVAHVLQSRYVFEDYYMGGNDLYKKNKRLKELSQKEEPEDIYAWLENLYEVEHDAVFEKRVEVNKSWYRMNVWYIVITLLIIAAALIYIVYTTAVILPRKNALLQAQNSYLDGDFVHVIDDLENISMEQMDRHVKYILAVSYIKGESLTPEQKENVLETITVDGEEKLKDYWIHLGRLNTVEAENIAMQRSDDELLLYAYMREKSILEKNTEISGEEKAKQLEELEKKIKELAKQYETEEAE